MKKIAAILLTTFSTMLFAFTNSQEINGVKYDFNFDKAPQRAVSMSQFTTEIMLKLGLKDNMAGTAFLEEEIYPSVASACSWKTSLTAQCFPCFSSNLFLPAYRHMF